jgi:hypothetical protein
MHVPPEHPQTYWKVAFEWLGDRVLSVESAPPRVAWRPAADVAQLTRFVGRILAHSVGAWDVAAVSKLGAEGAAAKILALPAD